MKLSAPVTGAPLSRCCGAGANLALSPFHASANSSSGPSVLGRLILLIAAVIAPFSFKNNFALKFCFIDHPLSRIGINLSNQVCFLQYHTHYAAVHHEYPTILIVPETEAELGRKAAAFLALNIITSSDNGPRRELRCRRALPVNNQSTTSPTS